MFASILATVQRVKVESHIDWEKTIIYSLVATALCVALIIIVNEIERACKGKRKKK